MFLKKLLGIGVATLIVFSQRESVAAPQVLSCGGGNSAVFSSEMLSAHATITNKTIYNTYVSASFELASGETCEPSGTCHNERYGDFPYNHLTKVRDTLLPVYAGFSAIRCLSTVYQSPEVFSDGLAQFPFLGTSTPVASVGGIEPCLGQFGCLTTSFTNPVSCTRPRLDLASSQLILCPNQVTSIFEAAELLWNNTTDPYGTLRPTFRRACDFAMIHQAGAGEERRERLLSGYSPPFTSVSDWALDETDRRAQDAYNFYLLGKNGDGTQSSFAGVSNGAAVMARAPSFNACKTKPTCHFGVTPTFTPSSGWSCF